MATTARQPARAAARSGASSPRTSQSEHRERRGVGPARRDERGTVVDPNILILLALSCRNRRPSPKGKTPVAPGWCSTSTRYALSLLAANPAAKCPGRPRRHGRLHRTRRTRSRAWWCGGCPERCAEAGSRAPGGVRQATVCRKRNKSDHGDRTATKGPRQ